MMRRAALLLFCSWSAVAASAFAGDVWPVPGVGFGPWYSLPPEEHGVVVFDLGLPISVRASVYGASVSLLGSGYRERMAGVQVGLLDCHAQEAYGVQFGLVTSAKRGYGVQAGLMNFYNDDSFRVQVGLWNAQQFSLNWNYGPTGHPGGHGVQVGLVNMSSDGGHVQFGVFNFGEDTVAVQIGLFNFANENTKCFQIGLTNERGSTATPLLGWRW